MDARPKQVQRTELPRKCLPGPGPAQHSKQSNQREDLAIQSCELIETKIGEGDTNGEE